MDISLGEVLQLDYMYVKSFLFVILASVGTLHRELNKAFCGYMTSDLQRWADREWPLLQEHSRNPPGNLI